MINDMKPQQRLWEVMPWGRDTSVFELTYLAQLTPRQVIQYLALFERNKKLRVYLGLADTVVSALDLIKEQRTTIYLRHAKNCVAFADTKK